MQKAARVLLRYTQILSVEILTTPPNRPSRRDMNLRITLFNAIVLFGPAFAIAADWTQWAGNDRRCRWNETGILTEFPAAGLKPRKRVARRDAVHASTGRNSRQSCLSVQLRAWSHAYSRAYHTGQRCYACLSPSVCREQNRPAEEGQNPRRAWLGRWGREPCRAVSIVLAIVALQQSVASLG